MDLKVSSGRGSTLFQDVDLEDHDRLLRIVKATLAEAKEGNVVTVSRVEGPYVP